MISIKAVFKIVRILVLTAFLGICNLQLAVYADVNDSAINYNLKKLPWDLDLLSLPPKVYDVNGYQQEGVKALLYQGLPFKGKETRVFAYYGLPDNYEPNTLVPAMVLVHGGGGTAFAQWVRIWNNKGYAAISMDWNGTYPDGKRHPWAGPAPYGYEEKAGMDKTERWGYHAIADIILANSLLRSFAEIDPEKIGIMGISWGGFLTSATTGIDQRFKLAIAVYGCGYLDQGSAFVKRFDQMGEENAKAWKELLDPSEYLHNATMPFLWLTGTNDKWYYLNAWQKSYRQPTGERNLALRVAMVHSHAASWDLPEIFAFADSILKNGVPLVRFVRQGRDAGQAWVMYDSKSPVKKAQLNYTTDSTEWPLRKWHTIDANIDRKNNKISQILPDGVTTYYFNLIDQRGLLASSEHVEL